MIEELKFLGKFTIFFFGGGGGRLGRDGGLGLLGGVRVDVNEELKFCENSKKKVGVGGGVGRGVGLVVGGQGGCERRIKVLERIEKKTGWGWSGVSGWWGGLGWM